MGRKAVPDGSEHIDSRGYVRVKVDGKWKFKHRHVAETQLLHRELKPGERVWFKDEDKTNCDPSNLDVRLPDAYASKQPYRIRASIKVLERKRAEIDEVIAGLKAQLEDLSKS
jgi:hypothetical protein